MTINVKKIEKNCKFCKKKPNSSCRNLEKHSIIFRDYTVTNCQTLQEVGYMRLEKSKNRQKNASFINKKIGKFLILKSWKPFHSKFFFSKLLSNGLFLALATAKTWKKEKEMSKNWKNLNVLSKRMLKFVMLNCWNHSTTTRNYAVTYNKTLEEILWNLGLKEQKITNTFKKLEKSVKISTKLRFYDQLFVSSHGGGGGGGRRFTGGLMGREGRGVGNSKRVGATARWGQ